MAVDPGQMEAGRSLGLNYMTTMVVIIIPQAIRAVLPALGNEFIVLLKDTSLITVIGGKELLYAAQGIICLLYTSLWTRPRAALCWHGAFLSPRTGCSWSLACAVHSALR